MHSALVFLFFYLPAYAAVPQDVSPPQESLCAPRGGPILMEYRRSPAPFKPYVQQLRTPSGINVLRDNVEDHLHHHGLMFAWKVDGVNFWEETAESGKQVTARKRDLRTGPEDLLTWVSPASKDLLQEARTVETFPSVDSKATVVNWKSEFKLPDGAAGPVAITGAHYHGLGMRFLKPMDGGAFVTSGADPGEVFRGEERLLKGRWCAYKAEVDGMNVTVAMFDHPKNPRPATWFTMAKPFGYLSATLRLHEQPLEISADKPVTVRYGVAAWDGHAAPDQIQRLYQAWLRAASMGDGR